LAELGVDRVHPGGEDVDPDFVGRGRAGVLDVADFDHLRRPEPGHHGGAHAAILSYPAG
jgi:hypothetical protein